MTKTAIIYARVSSARQAEDELPIQSQVDQCRSKAQSLGADIVHEFLDEGRSGRTDNRPAFLSAIEFCELNEPTYFITWSTSRFVRNRMDAILYKKRLAQCGTDLQFVSLHLDRDSLGGWMTEAMMELYDEFSSRSTAADTKRSMLKNARDGYWNGGRAPYGYQAVAAPDNPKRKKLEPIETEAAIVRDIFALNQGGMGSKRIAVRLNESDILRRGKLWRRQTVLDLLNNPAVAGRVRFGRRDKIGGSAAPDSECIIVDAHEPIIKPEIWDAITRNGENHAPRPGSQKSTHRFNGLLTCKPCGSTMKIETATGRAKKRYSYYNCSDFLAGYGCESHRLPSRALEDRLLSEISNRILTRENMQGIVNDLTSSVGEWATSNRARKAATQREISSLETKNSKIFEVMESLGRDTPNLGDTTKRLRANSAQIKKLEQKLSKIELETAPEIALDNKDVLELCDFTMDLLLNSDPVNIRSFMASFIDSIEISEEAAAITYKPALIISGRAVHSDRIWLLDLGSNQGPND